MPTIASYRHRFEAPTKPTDSHQDIVAFGLNDSQESIQPVSEADHAHDWRRQPAESQPLAADNKFIWYCTGCNALKTLDSWQKP